jgi:hypothetical protein
MEQFGSTVKGLVRVTPRGNAPGSIEGTVARDVFRFRDPRGALDGELTVSGDRMDGRMNLPRFRGHPRSHESAVGVVHDQAAGVHEGV